MAIEGMILPECALADGAIDPVRAAHFFLSGQHEPGLEQQGQNVPGRKLEEWGLLQNPTVDVLALRLAERLRGLAPAPPRPRWPKGKKWALVLSHDCDRPHRYRPLGYCRDSIEFRRKGQAMPAARAAAQAVYSLLMRAVRPDPYVESVRQFVAHEKAIGLAGTYYFGVWSRYEPGSTEHDLPYSHRDRRVAKLARELAAEGMEIGLHSGICAWRGAGRYEEEANRFAEAYGQRPKGVRAHFWSLEPGQPERTMRQMNSAGFLYDSSLGMNECHGFRRGTCYPFTPFEAGTGASSNLVQVPPILMDDSLPREGSPAAWADSVRCIAQQVRAAQGALVLDWHSDTLRAPRWATMTKVVMQEVAALASEPECWPASCAEVAEWAAVTRWQ